VGVQREVEVGLQRRLRRELQVEPLIICLVQPAPAGTPAYKGRADAEPDTRPAPRGRRDGGREISREVVRDPARVSVVAAAAQPAPVPVSAAVGAPVVQQERVARPIEDSEPAGRTRRRRSAAVAG